MRAHLGVVMACAIVVGGVVAVACGPSIPGIAAPQQADLDSLYATFPSTTLYDTTVVADTALVNRIFAAFTHPGPPSRTHVQCHALRNLRTRPTLPVGPADTTGPSGEICAVRGGHKRKQSQLTGVPIATVQIDSVLVPGGLTDVPNLGMEQGRNLILVKEGGPTGCRAKVLTARGLFSNVACDIEQLDPKDHGYNGLDISIWRENATTGCVSCIKHGWCTIGD